MKIFPKWVRSKYFLSGAGFLVWLLFFDHNNLFLQVSRTRELRELNQSKAYYSGQIEAANKELGELFNNPSALEKTARERYLMKRDNEDLFLIEDQ